MIGSFIAGVVRRPVTTAMLTIALLLFGLVAAMLDEFNVAGFWSALFGAIIVSITSTLASWFIGPDGRYDVMIIERR